METLTSKIKKVHYIHLEKGEDILFTLKKYCESKKIQSGIIMGIGAVERANIGFFDIEKKEYVSNSYDFNAEIVNCTGNIAINNDTNKVIVHLHITIGDINGKTYGGHVQDNTPISVTGEFKILETQKEIVRKVDKRTGLYLQSLE